MRQHELAGDAVAHLEGDAGLGVDKLGVDEATPAQMHSLLLLALPPQRHADVADAHRLGDPCAPARFELATERRLATAGLTRHEDALDARRLEVDTALRRPFEEMVGV